MFTITLEVYKYGEFKEIEVKEFSSIVELEKWVNAIVEYTNFISEESERYNEDISRFTANFSYNGEKYHVNLDY